MFRVVVVVVVVVITGSAHQKVILLHMYLLLLYNLSHPNFYLKVYFIRSISEAFELYNKHI